MFESWNVVCMYFENSGNIVMFCRMNIQKFLIFLYVCTIWLYDIYDIRIWLKNFDRRMVEYFQIYDR